MVRSWQVVLDPVAGQIPVDEGRRDKGDTNLDDDIVQHLDIV